MTSSGGEISLGWPRSGIRVIDDDLVIGRHRHLSRVVGGAYPRPTHRDAPPAQRD